MECFTCKFWNCPVEYDRMKAKDTDQFKCLLEPPKAQLVPAQGMGGMTLQTVSFWPESPAFGFCGKYLNYAVLNTYSEGISKLS